MSDIASRLFERDTTLWPKGNVAADRLGWLDVAARMRTEAAALRSWADGISRERVVLLGMGGSSLGPEVLRDAVASTHLTVLDTTDPATVAEATENLDGALIVVSSKSGGTLEVEALLAHCWHRLPDGSRYVAITDPGTSLDALATERGFARVFRNPSDIGGRYSVLSYFGLVPAVLLGYDVAALCDSALAVNVAAAVEVGVAMAAAAKDGRDKATIVVPPAFAAFGLWVEQLVAESLGKRGTGVVPVPTTELEDGPDRHRIPVTLETANDLGGEFFRWEIAVAAAGSVLRVDPFDEPNVAESKSNTAKVLAELPLPEIESEDPSTVGSWLEATANDGDYVSLQAYLPYRMAGDLDDVRRALRDRLGGMAVTAGFGPRFLHSTGQLHKGGPPSCVAVQVVARHPTAELAVPDHGYDFATLIAAQAIGDHRSLTDHERRVLRVGVDTLDEIV